MDRDDLDYLISRLTNFYKEHLPIHSEYEKLLSVYGDVALHIHRMIEKMMDNVSPSSHHELDVIPYFQIDIVAGLYDEVLANRLKKLDLNHQIAFLEEQKLYVALEFSRALRLPEIYSATLKVNFMDTEILTLNSDYFISNNKLYLLPRFIKTYKDVKMLHAFDIYYNGFFLEQNFGALTELEFSDLVVRSDAKKIIHAFEAVLSSDLTIQKIEQAVQLATGWTTFKIEDAHTKNLSSLKKRLYDSYELSPLIFLVTLPEEAREDIIKTTIMYYLLDLVKQAQTNYAVVHEEMQNDGLLTGTSVFVTPTKQGVRYDTEDFVYDVADEHGYFCFYD